MEAKITDHQLYQIIDYIKKSYKTYGVQEKNGRRSFSLLEKGSDINFSLKKPILSFKKVLFPNGLPVEAKEKEKIALIGLKNCDVWALQSFLKEFSKTDILPKIEDILVVASDCLPDQSCFCEAMGTNKIAPFDLYLQEKKGNFEIFSGSEIGKRILNKVGVKESSSKLTIDEIKSGELIPLDKLSKIIEDRAGNEKFWDAIADTCFGCGACVAVCPLCFCTRQEFVLPLAKGSSPARGEVRWGGSREQEGVDDSTQCFKWDACFAKRFSEVQNHYDLRPKNVDRLYNWYHHKFVRAKFESNHYLCTGCGRCIEACPANLNMKSIIETLLKLNKINF